jgi:hypothetical protein
MYQMFSYKGLHAAQKFSLGMGFALALGASLTGCAVGPKYHRPTVKLQPFHNTPSIDARTTSLPAPPLDQWWTGFRDPELTRIVKRALGVEESRRSAVGPHRIEGVASRLLAVSVPRYVQRFKHIHGGG